LYWLCKSEIENASLADIEIRVCEELLMHVFFIEHAVDLCSRRLKIQVLSQEYTRRMDADSDLYGRTLRPIQDIELDTRLVCVV
jgi:hypothetical protein